MCLCATVASQPEKPPAVSDDAACKDALLAATRAFIKGESTARELYTMAEGGEAREFEAMLSLVAAGERLNGEIYKRLDPNKRDEIQASQTQAEHAILESIARGSITVTGDRATVIYECANPESPTGKSTLTRYLIKRDGRWKVDAARAFGLQGQADRVNEYNDAAWASDEVAKDVRDGSATPPYFADSMVRRKLLERTLSRGRSVAAEIQPKHPTELAPTPEELHRWKSSGTVHCIATIAGGFVSGSVGNGASVALWSSAGDAPIRTFGDKESEFHAVDLAVTSDGKLIVAGGVAYDPREAAKALAKGGGNVAYSSVESKDQDLRVWDAGTGTQVHRLSGHTRAVQAIAMSPDDRVFASGGADGEVIIWDLKSGEKLKQFQAVAQPFSVRGLSFSPDGKLLAVGVHWDKGSVAVYNTTDWSKVWTADIDRCIGGLRFSPDGATLAVIRLGAVMLYSSSGEKKGVLPCLGGGQAALVNSIAFSRDSKVVYCAEGVEVTPGKSALESMVMDITPGIRVFNVESQKQVALIRGHSNAVWTVVVSPDGRGFMSSSADGTIRSWKAPRVVEPVGQK